MMKDEIPAQNLISRRKTMNYFAAASISLLFLFSCANPGAKSLTGGPKDETPPVVVKSVPENYSTNFIATEVEITFDEYLKSLQGLNQKLIISPVMDEIPEIKIRGKSIVIKFKTELLPDRTYALNFGDAVADLNEGNVFENFMYVFSTGDQLDSLEMSGIVRSAIDNKPLEGTAVMLYQDDQDSLPLTDLPIYLSITNKEGLFSLRNLAGGSYKVFALKDGNSNFLFDQLKEEIGFLDTLITPGVRIIEKLLATDTITLADTLQVSDSLSLPNTISLTDSLLLADTIKSPEKKSKYEYYPKNIELYTFTEIINRQFISSSGRPLKNKIEIIFNQALDSLSIDLLPEIDTLPYPNINLLTNTTDSSPFALHYSPTLDSIDIWLTDTTLAKRDTLIFNFQYTGYDSIEQPIPFSDTVSFSFRQTTPKKDDKQSNPFKIQTNFSKIKELGQAARITFSEPWAKMDTSRIELARTRDTLIFPMEFKLKPDTLELFNIQCSRSGLVGPGEEKRIAYPRIDQETIIEDTSIINTLNYALDQVFLPDSSYSLTLLPGAFTTHAGLSNDTTKISFRVNTEEKYGSIVLEMEELQQPVILQLLKGKEKIVAERRLDTSGTVVFALLKPGKYKLKLIFDKNNNGQWDPGRYLLGIQPERVLYYDKELELKANWEMEETWTLEKE